jgi:hypothetical protein
MALPLLSCLAMMSPAPAGDRPRSEKQKIEALIEHVEGLEDARFVRNGREYDGKTAARFLRGKWESNEDDVRTAKDFIEKVARASSTSGKPYLIRFKDGKETKSADYLLAELKKLEKSPADQGKQKAGGKTRRP